MSVLAAMSQQPFTIRVGTVLSVTGTVATVDIAGSEVEAQLTAQTAAVVADATVYVVRVADTRLVIASLP